jgi:hypothetical protein
MTGRQVGGPPESMVDVDRHVPRLAVAMHGMCQWQGGMKRTHAQIGQAQPLLLGDADDAVAI